MLPQKSGKPCREASGRSLFAEELPGKRASQLSGTAVKPNDKASVLAQERGSASQARYSPSVREISAFWLPEDFRQVERSRNCSRPGAGSPHPEAGRVAGDQKAEEATAAGQEYGAA